MFNICKRQILSIALVLPLSAPALANANEKGRKSLSTTRAIFVNYGSPSWNVDSRKIDDAFLMIRDKQTGKFVQIQLEETAPDSAQFVGSFKVNIGEQIVPDIYVPPENLRKDLNATKQMYTLIQSGKLQRKPMIWKRNAKGQALMDVYDTREQAQSALKAFENEQAAARALRRLKKPSGAAKGQSLATSQEESRKAQLDSLALQAAQRMAERVRLEQIERQKVLQRQQEQKLMSESERKKQRAKAAKFAAEASRQYDLGQFKPAEENFRQAIELDPENRDYHYKYGVTLYRNEKFNEALVALKVAKVAPAVEMERDYFMGLVHFRLSELDNALEKFKTVAKSSQPNLAPSAEFYAGVVYFSQEKYLEAKTSFETVIDTSTDANMDKQAEDYIDRIAAAEAFKKMQENKFTVMGVVGAMYDSNVLLSPDNATGTATDTADFRLLTILNLQYRPIYNERNEFSTSAMANLTNSIKDESAAADPFIYTLQAPYSRSTKLGDKGLKLTFTPGYELLYLDPSSTGTKQRSQASYYLSTDANFVMSKDWISILTLEYRDDNSYDASSTGPENLDAERYTLRSTQMFLLEKKRSLLPSVGYAQNSASGKNKIYNRIDLGVTYVSPLPWETNGSVGLSAYQMKYGSAETPRTDTNYTLTLGLTKPIYSWMTWGMNGTYTKNGSNISANEYTKYMVMTTATFITNF